MVRIYNLDDLKGRSNIDIVSLYDNLSLFRKKGLDSSKSIFISTILHGHESAGLNAILKEINSYCCDYNYDIYVMLGNTGAAKYNEIFFTYRLMPTGQNFNRIWVNNPKTKIEFKSEEIINFMKGLNLIGVLDIHSFTADTICPHVYISSIDDKTLNLAKCMVPFIFENGEDDGLLINRTSKFVTSIILEAGTNGTISADNYAFDSLQRFFKFFNVKNSNIVLDDISIGFFSNETNIKFLNLDINFSNLYSSGLINLREDLENFNIFKIKSGEVFGYADSLDFLTSNVGSIDEHFDIIDGVIYFKYNCTINLFTKNIERMIESGFYIYKDN